MSILLLQLFMHYGYIGKWGHVPCCWLGEAWLEIPVSFYKLLGFVHMEQYQERKLCLKYLLNTSQPVSSLFGHEVKLVILEQILQHTTWLLPWGFPSSLPSQPLVSSSAAALLWVYFQRKPSSTQPCSLAGDKDQTSILEISSNEQQLLGRVSCSYVQHMFKNRWEK